MGGGLGGTFRITTEFLIFATKGKLKAKKNVIGTWFEQKRQYVNGFPCHSKKPDFFYELIESVSPGNYLELFARNERKGWDVLNSVQRWAYYAGLEAFHNCLKHLQMFGFAICSSAAGQAKLA